MYTRTYHGIIETAGLIYECYDSICALKAWHWTVTKYQHYHSYQNQCTDTFSNISHICWVQSEILRSGRRFFYTESRHAVIMFNLSKRYCSVQSWFRIVLYARYTLRDCKQTLNNLQQHHHKWFSWQETVSQCISDEEVVSERYEQAS